MFKPIAFFSSRVFGGCFTWVSEGCLPRIFEWFVPRVFGRRYRRVFEWRFPRVFGRHVRVCLGALGLGVLLPWAGMGQTTFCNPLNLPYNFQSPGATRREAADPLVVLYKGNYYLFASKQIGYWWSGDLLHWQLIRPTGLPLQVYAPAVAVVDGRLYYTAGEDKGTFTTDDPKEGHWTPVNPYKKGCSDPDLFQDGDGRVYLFDGCSDKTPLRVTELDRHTFLPADDQTNTIAAQTSRHGWEVPGDNNELNSQAPWIEGSWVNKINGRYYWQYAGPGTQFKTYGDGVYVSDKPTGPFVYQTYSPFSFKPTGFIAGAGHSATFADAKGDYWHIATGTISVRHMFERRLVLFPTAVLGDGQLVTNTYLGDYPQLAPGTAADHLMGNLAGWMLVSYHKRAMASSTLAASSTLTAGGPPAADYPAPAGSGLAGPSAAFDEDIRTWWSAKTGDAGEWLEVDLGKICRVNAIQVNFADQDAEQQGPLVGDGYRYSIEVSADGKHWQVVVDYRDKDRDVPHDYTELEKPAMARYVRITNGHSPAHSRFSLYDLRVFGSALGQAPAAPTGVTVTRDPADQRHAHIKWAHGAGVDFYIVRYGIARDRLFGNYQVYDGDELDIRSLNTGVKYYFTVDAVNGSGVTKGTRVIER